MSEVLSQDTNTFRINNNVTSYKFTLPSIATSGSDEVQLPTSLKGVIQGIRIVSTSVDYTISLRTQQSLTTPSINEILKIENINLDHNEVNLLIPYICEEYLYLLITNNDSTNATGVIDLELIASVV